MEDEPRRAASLRRSHHRHLVAMPYPGRGHINPMLNLCSLLSSQPDLLISFVVTEEWLGFLTAELHPPPPSNLRLVGVPQVIPSEIGRAADFTGFYEATNTKLQDPFERLLDRLEPPATAIVYDTFLSWVVRVGNKKNIPVASLFTQSASVFTLLSHFDLLDFIGEALSRAPYWSSHVGVSREVLRRVFEAISIANKAHCLLFTSVHELEEQVIDALKAKLPIPIYPVGPMIPYFKLQSNGIRRGTSNCHDDRSYFQWLDSQPRGSVLYISQGSFLSLSSAQMDEIVAGIKESGVRFLWVTRGDCSRFKDGIGELGYLVPWCDQLKVLCHPSVGGFWTHCGWNSTWEGVYAGVPMLTCPIFWDQVPNSKLIVSDWKMGWKAMDNGLKETLVTRHEIAQTVKKFMDSKGDERKELVNRAKSIQDICRKAIVKGANSTANIRRGHHRHLVALPYPGRGHINPMLNLCSLILSSQPDLLISFIVTEEWRGILTAELHPSPPTNLRLVGVPQVIPSEIGRAANSPGFYEAVNTKLQDPFEQLFDRLQPTATAIIYDAFIAWVVGVGNKRNILVASLFTQSASVFTVYYHLELLVQHGHLPLHLDASEKGKEKVDYIPGLPPTSIADLPTLFDEVRRKMLP
ncbi:hypothetical protein Cgig2_023980 [Carnegiea gigantea]|uniref:Uncharacterized protein n=1 Tax=Carnegiea gigantea TaxID=171969 RepID=A0A9Q1KC37_9CARY|nr:hypothetical protein Cgig2_023980 [Carnegiea gigantea]